MDEFDFTEALRLLHLGGKVRPVGWRGHIELDLAAGQFITVSQSGVRWTWEPSAVLILGRWTMVT